MAVSEAWRDVPGYGGKYQASDMGRIANTFWRGQRRQNGGRTIMAQFKKKPHGNARESAKRFVHLTDLEGHRKEISAAKVVAETFLGPVPPGMAIFHKNGNPADNSVWNLVFRTPEEIGRMTGADSTRRPVLKFSATGELLECYSSAARLQSRTISATRPLLTDATANVNGTFWPRTATITPGTTPWA